MSLLLTQNIDDMGLGLIYSSEWVPGKKYHVGDIVLYNEESWILYEGSGGTNFTICQMNDNNRFDEGFDYYGNYNGKLMKLSLIVLKMLIGEEMSQMTYHILQKIANINSINQIQAQILTYYQ